MKRFKVYLIDGPYDSVVIDKPGTYFVNMPGLIECLDKGWKVDKKRFFYNGKLLEVEWYGETDCVKFPVKVKFVYKEFDEVSYKFSHVEA